MRIVVILSVLVASAQCVPRSFQDTLLESISAGDSRQCITSDPNRKAEKAADCKGKVPQYPDPTQVQEIAAFDEKSISWFKECIVDFYCFEKDAKVSSWTKQPSFEGQLDDDHFQVAASLTEVFFKKDGNRRWTGADGIVKTWKPNGCLKLLYITAARYVYITYLLASESKEQDGEGKAVSGAKSRLIPCEMEHGKIKIPEYACYPVPYGSATCTADYDVGLVGPKSGELAANFNDRFFEVFNTASTEIFDTNVYAFTLEYSMPSLFSGQSSNFLQEIEAMENSEKYKMQDLVAALFKLKKYRISNYATILETLRTKLPSASAREFLRMWNSLLSTWESEIQEKKVDPDELKKKHTEKYNSLVQDILEGTEKDDFRAKYMLEVILALIYSTESYHSRGVVRYVVGWTQMRDNGIKDNITPLDLWTSMLENWGNSMREWNLCMHSKVGERQVAEECLVRMSKYMWRTFLTMKDIYGVLDEKNGLKDISSVEESMRNWLYNLKKAGEMKITKEGEVKNFMDFFGCNPATDGVGKVISEDCIDRIFDYIKPYSFRLMALVFPSKNGKKAGGGSSSKKRSQIVKKLRKISASESLLHV